MEEFKEIREQAVQFFMKIVLPAIAWITVKVSILIKDKKATISGVIVSYVSGITVCGFSFSLFDHFLDGVWLGVIMGAVALASEKIARFFIFDLDVGKLFNSAMNILVDKWKAK